MFSLVSCRQSKILKRTIQCCALNGGVFWASILVFEGGLLPFLKYLLSIIFGHSPGMGMTVWSWTKPFLSLTFGTVWVLPLFLLSRIVNSLWFQVNEKKKKKNTLAILLHICGAGLKLRMKNNQKGFNFNFLRYDSKFI